MRLIFLFYGCIFSWQVFSLPIIEVAPLSESNLANMYNVGSKSESKGLVFQYDTAMINQIKAKLPMINNLIKSKLLSSKLFVVTDAQSILAMWQAESPNILSILRDASIISESQALIQKNVKLSSGLKPRYILLGWITGIDSWERKEKIFNSDGFSFLSSLDIWIKYKVVDSYSKQVTMEFIAVGHYGLAKILPNIGKNINFTIEPIISGAIDNLANDVLRVLSAEFPNLSSQNESKIKFINK